MLRLTARAALRGLCAVLVCAGCAKAADDKADRLAVLLGQLLGEQHRCLDLPGKARRALRAGPRHTVEYVARQVGPAGPRWDLVSLDLASRRERTLLGDVGPWAVPVGGSRAVTFRGKPREDGRPQELWLITTTSSVRVSEAREVVGEMVVDTARDVLWFDGGAGLVRVDLTHGHRDALGPARPLRPLTVLEDGALLVADGEDLGRMGPGATPFVRTRPAPPELARPERGSVAPRRTNPAAPRGTDLFPVSGGVWLARTRPPGDLVRLAWTDGAATHAGPGLHSVGVTGLASLPDGILAVLWQQDTNGSGLADLDDESDVCLLRPDDRWHREPKRTQPKRFLATWPAVEAVLSREGVSPAHGYRADRWQFDWPAPTVDPDLRAFPAPVLRIVASSPAPSRDQPVPARATSLLEWGAAIGPRLAAASGEPRLALDVRWTDDVTWVADWSGTLGRLVHRVRIGPQTFDRGADHVLEVVAFSGYTSVAGCLCGWGDGHVLEPGEIDGFASSCSGRVRNRGDQPLRLGVRCGSSRVLQRQAAVFPLGILQPGTEASWSFRFQEYNNLDDEIGVRFYLDGKPVPAAGMPAPVP